jgi:hypothetical protein
MTIRTHGRPGVSDDAGAATVIVGKTRPSRRLPHRKQHNATPANQKHEELRSLPSTTPQQESEQPFTNVPLMNRMGEYDDMSFTGIYQEGVEMYRKMVLEDPIGALSL